MSPTPIYMKKIADSECLRGNQSMGTLQKTKKFLASF